MSKGPSLSSITTKMSDKVSDLGMSQLSLNSSSKDGSLRRSKDDGKKKGLFGQDEMVIIRITKLAVVYILQRDMNVHDLVFSLYGLRACKLRQDNVSMKFLRDSTQQPLALQPYSTKQTRLIPVRTITQDSDDSVARSFPSCQLCSRPYV